MNPNELVPREDGSEPAEIVDDQYSYTVKAAVLYFLQHGYRYAPRTLMWYCETELLDCKKFACGSALKWKITRKSLDERIETLKREGVVTAANGEQLPVGMPVGNGEQLRATASNYEEELLELLKGELKDKNKQIDEFQNIIREHNKQFENLNKTIQLSNETIQQLNRTLALPQVKDVLGAMHADPNNFMDGGPVPASHVHYDSSDNVEFGHSDETETQAVSEAPPPENSTFEEPDRKSPSF